MASSRHSLTHLLPNIHAHSSTKNNNCKTLNSPNMTPSFTGPLTVQCGGGRRPGSLAPAPQDCSKSEAFSPRTVLTENICKCVQHILQHFQQLSRFLHGPESAHKNGIVKTFPHTSIPTHPCTLIKKEREKQRAKRSTDQIWCLRLLVLFLSTLVVGGGQEAWHLMNAPRRRPCRLGQYWQKTFVDVFNKYSNIASQKSLF